MGCAFFQNVTQKSRSTIFEIIDRTLDLKLNRDHSLNCREKFIISCTYICVNISFLTIIYR